MSGLDPATNAVSRPLRANLRRLGGGLICLAAVAAAASSLLVVNESEYVIVERLGQIHAVYDRGADRGLHFKLPWPVDVARRFDARVRLFDPPGREVFTRDRKNITVDAFVCWRIAGGDEGDSPEGLAVDSERSVVRFYRSLGDPEVAEARLESRLRSVLNTAIGQIEMSDLLSVSDSTQGPNASRTSLLTELAERVREQVQATEDGGSSLAEQAGIELVDLRIKRINFPEGNQQAVFERMRSERQKIAESYRSSGMAESSVIRSSADRQYQEVLARAEADAEKIRGDAEAEAIGILNQAYAADPEFYEVVRTLDAYRQIIGERTTLVLSSQSPLFRLLTEGLPVRGSSAGAGQPPAADLPGPKRSGNLSQPGSAATTPAGEGQ